MKYDRPIKRVRWPKVKNKDCYTQTELSEVLKIPTVYIRLLLDAGRLTAGFEKGHRIVIFDKFQFRDAVVSWSTCYQRGKRLVMKSARKRIYERRHATG